MRTSSSQVERRQSLPRLVCGLWAGLACGMLAGVAALVWFALHSLMRGEFWWAKFNVAAGWFYDTAVYQAGLGGVTLCGACVIVLFYCLAGACYAWIWPALFRTRALLTAFLYAAGVYVFASYFIWPSFGIFARLWFPWTATLPSHFALFAMLIRYPELYARLVNDFGDPSWLQQQQRELPAKLLQMQPHETKIEASDNGSSDAERPVD
jgi:hypothetical protein